MIVAQRLIDVVRELGDRFQWPWGPPPNPGSAVPGC
jgi:hypothetical protein